MVPTSQPGALNPPSFSKRRWRRRFIALVGGLALLAALALSRSPAVPPTPPPTAADAIALRGVFDRVRDLGLTKNPTPIKLSWAEYSALSALGGRATSLSHIAATHKNDMAIVEASIPLPLGFWANVTANVTRDDGGQALIRGRIGAIPLPGPVMRGAIAVTRFAMSRRGIDVPPVDDVIRTITISNAGIRADIAVPDGVGFSQALGGLQPEPISAQAVGRHYCRIVRLEEAQPTRDFAEHVRRTFAGNFDEGRARLIALAMLTVSPDVAQLVGQKADLTKGCALVRASPTLNKRSDLAKHWALSAALTASLGPDASLAMGIWKEMADSGQGGSGFSYADLAADRGGVMVAQRLEDAARAPAIHKWLSQATQAQLLPIQRLALAEGMSEAEFADRYDSIDSARDKEMVARIDAALSATLPR